MVFASSVSYKTNEESWNGILFDGDIGKVYGTSVTPTYDFEIPSDKTLIVDSGKTLTADVTVKNDGTIINKGTIVENVPISGGGTIYYSVTDITGVPATATAGIPLPLTGTVFPSYATVADKSIVWTVKSPETTGATIDPVTNTFNATAEGTVTITATITNGETPTTPYTQDFIITVSADFGPNPSTGLPHITETALATLVLIVMSAILWGVVLRRRLSNGNNE